ncbi:MAG TPA: TIGR02996 domain-containing protein [Kofleriaceae bacterium]|nr:TIGR02996 domain-containing protein [Kofleriaceae bacterium]
MARTVQRPRRPSTGPGASADAPVTPEPPDLLREDPVIAALVHEVHARPDCDDARLVLADALLGHGDPRGELIALQLTPSRDDRQIDRIEQLLREHARRWLGPLREVTYRARFVRGFPTRLELNGRWTATEAGWARHVVDPMLATIEDLIPGRSVGQSYARFVASPAMTALRRIEVFDRPTLEALRETPASLIHVSCPRWKVGKYVHELETHVLPACERFAHLRSFSVYIDGVASVMGSGVFPQLTRLTVAGGLARGLALWPRLPRTLSLTIARSAVLDDCATTRVVWTGALELARDGEHEGERVVARGAGDWLISELVEHFAALPSEVIRLEIEGAGEHAAALSAAAARRGIELVLRPIARRTGYVAGLDR